MRKSTRFSRVIAFTAVAVGASLLLACTEPPDSVTGPPLRAQFGGNADDIRAAIAAQERHNPALLRMSGVVGTAVGILADGKPGIRIFLDRPDVGGFPAAFDGIPTRVEVTGRFMALSTPTLRMRPAPLGFSVGHPAITAGTIGARVADGSGNVFVLSNNHVLANSNDAAVGDAALQPGPYDGGTATDQIGTLFAFKPIDFSGGLNTIDAAIALTTTADADNATPSDDGYGAPNSAIFNDANGDGLFDDKTTLLNVNVQKYGRTTKLTKGKITGINASVSICYEVVFIFCVKSANYSDQLIIEPGGFSDGGDSGSLIVSDDANKNPVALLFAGSDTETIANRIDLVLSYFGVRIDVGAGAPPPPPPPPPPPSSSIHVGDLDGSASSSGTTWSATVEVTVHDANHNALNGATVVGSWSVAGLNSDTCTTGDLGGSGTCIFLFPNLKRSVKTVTFTVKSVTMQDQGYLSAANHDPDGSSNGTAVKVKRP